MYYVLWEGGGTCNRWVFVSDKKTNEAEIPIYCEDITRNPKESGYLALERQLKDHGFEPSNPHLKKTTWKHKKTGEVFGGILIAVAGVVTEQGEIFATNRFWDINYQTLKEKYGLFCVKIFNDVEAQGGAIPNLIEQIGQNNQCSQLNKEELPFGPKMLKKPKFLISIGTGLGACSILSTESSSVQVLKGEFGQGVPPFSKKIAEILPFMRIDGKEVLNPTLENILSGKGLTFLYSAYARKYGARIPKEMDAQKICKEAQEFYESFLTKENINLFKEVLKDRKISRGAIAFQSVLTMLDTLGRFIHNIYSSGPFPEGGVVIAGKIVNHPFIRTVLESPSFKQLTVSATHTIQNHYKKMPLFLCHVSSDEIGIRGMYDTYKRLMKTQQEQQGIAVVEMAKSPRFIVRNSELNSQKEKS